MLADFAACCFVGTLLTDVVYWQTAQMMWADFSAWLVTVGVIVGYVAVVVTLIEIVAVRSFRRRRPTWSYAIGTLVALIVSTFNMLVHTRDAWTSVAPWGMVLSAVVVVVLLVTAWMDREAIYTAGAEVTG